MNSDETLQSHFKRTLIIRYSTEFLFIILLQSVGIKLQNHIPLSFGTAINLIIILWRGPRTIIGVFIGILAVNLLDLPTYTQAFGLTILYTFQPWLIIYTLKKLGSPVIPLQLQRDRIYYCLVCILSGLIFSYPIAKLLQQEILLTTVSILNGVLLLTPGCLIWAGYPEPMAQFKNLPLKNICCNHYFVSLINLTIVVLLLPILMHFQSTIYSSYYYFSGILLALTVFTYSVLKNHKPIPKVTGIVSK